MSQSNINSFIPTHAQEAVKQYLVYDGQSRMEFVYVASAGAKHGEPCMGTQYAYDSGSVRIIKSKEFVAAWDSSWDI